jgi:hypothetical protein
MPVAAGLSRPGQCSQEAGELAEQVQHPMAAGHALGRSCWLAALKGELQDAGGYAAALDQVAQEFGMRDFVLAALLLRHWAAIHGGTPTAGGLTQVNQAMEDYHGTGTVLDRPALLVFFG